MDKRTEDYIYINTSLEFSAFKDDIVRKNVNNGLNLYLTLIDRAIINIPPHIVVDLYLLFKHRNPSDFKSFEDLGNNENVQGIIRYANEFLFRLMMENVFQDVSREIRLCSGGKKKSIINRVAEIYCSVLSGLYPSAWTVNRGLIEDVTTSGLGRYGKSEEEKALIAEFRSKFNSEMEIFIQNIIEKFPFADVMKEEDLFELQYIEIMKDDFLRRACRQIISTRNAVPELDISYVRGLNERYETETTLSKQTTFPIGGYYSITNRGPVENILPAELLYINEPDKKLDLFSYRLAESEMLYYLRDDGQLIRRRMEVIIVIDHSKSMKVQYPFHNVRISNLIHGYILSFMRDLNLIFKNCNVKFRIIRYTVKKEFEEEHNADNRILGFLLHNDIDMGNVTIEKTRDCSKILSEQGISRRGYPLVISLGSVSNELFKSWSSSAGWRKSAWLSMCSEQESKVIKNNIKIGLELITNYLEELAGVTYKIIHHFLN